MCISIPVRGISIKDYQKRKKTNKQIIKYLISLQIGNLVVLISPKLFFRIGINSDMNLMIIIIVILAVSLQINSWHPLKVQPLQVTVEIYKKLSLYTIFHLNSLFKSSRCYLPFQVLPSFLVTYAIHLVVTAAHVMQFPLDGTILCFMISLT